MAITESTVASAHQLLSGERRTWRGYAAFAGPAIVASVAYVDPGNFATNIQAGAKYGYELLWIVLLANLIAMLFQGLSAKLGVATGRNLAELCRETFPLPVAVVMWIVSEIAAIATDLAEFVGGTLALSLLFHLPLLSGMLITGMIVYTILLFEGFGFRPIELIIGVCIGLISLSYIFELFVAPVDWGSAAVHAVSPSVPDSQALVLAVGIVGATVMPHAIFLHSGLTQTRVTPRNGDEKRRIIRISNKEVIVAFALAGGVNMSMVMMASAAFHAGYSDVAELETAFATLKPLLGAAAAMVFLVSLLISGISSAAVGTMAGQMIMQGFVGFTIPMWVRRLVTMLPAFAIIGVGVDPTYALVLSQVVLSLALPIPMIALLLFTSRRDIMGDFVNRPVVTIVGIVGTGVVLSLNVVLVLDTLGLSLFAWLG